MTKVFVLDTSVILYDANALDSFQEHDLAIPVTVLEELDTFKKGNNVLNLHAREFLRRLDRLSEDHDLRSWLPLNGSTRGRLRVIAENGHFEHTAELLGSRRNDHRILAAALGLAEQSPDRPVILVSKDINLRVKARSIGLKAEDYETVQVADVDHLYSGKSTHQLSDDEVLDELYRERRLPIDRILPEPPLDHHYLVLRGPSRSALAVARRAEGNVALLEKTPAYGILPRNAEQTFALDAILDDSIPLVTISGAAGTGKTLLALAGALQQRRQYRQIYLARPIVPLNNRDLGFLPGDIEAKMSPFMQPLWDNLNVIKNQYSERAREYQQIVGMVEQDKLQIVPLAYIRGRSLANVIFIVDEAQNLTPLEIKTIITRAGEGTKIVFTGDVFQIDTPYLDAQSNGLAYLIDRMKGHPLYAHVNLEKGERSELANLASRVL
ncbi:MAG TPA: PhoH family protein [Thermoanaerobaculia bacterium]|nr:PhoH family protein [Thermoanaerobaculia bacterium]